MNDTNIIERAFQLAPECATIEDVRRKLIAEGYFSVHQHLSGKHIRRQLNDLVDVSLKSAHGIHGRTPSSV